MLPFKTDEPETYRMRCNGFAVEMTRRCQGCALGAKANSNIRRNDAVKTFFFILALTSVLIAQAPYDLVLKAGLL